MLSLSSIHKAVRVPARAHKDVVRHGPHQELEEGWAG